MNKEIFNQGFVDINSQSNLFNPDEAILVGTAFKSLYEPYKGFKKANVRLLSEKERLMYDIQKYDLISHDLGLYLDVFPLDKEAVNLRKKYLSLYDDSIRRYLEKYPPFEVTCEKNNKTPYPWSTTPFPGGEK